MSITDLRIDRFPVKGRRFLVYGLARSGIGAARLLLQLGGIVTGIDDASEFKEEIRERVEQLVAMGMSFYLKPDIDAKLKLIHGSDVLVVSPGIALGAEIRDACREAGCEIIGEFELGSRLCPCRIVTVSGSNGKTTTVCLLYESLLAAGMTVHLVGNVGSSYNREKSSGYFIGEKKVLFTDGIGVPFCERVADMSPGDVVVAEISSYQLESAPELHPIAAVLMNITEDHLARHGDMAGYIAAKGKMFANQTSDDFAVLNADDLLVMQAFRGSGGHASVLKFSLISDDADAYYHDGMVFIRVDGQPALLVKRGEFMPPGDHNVQNLIAAALAARVMGAGVDDVRRVARSFRGVEHRIEFVGEFDGVKVYNDSKGTNPDSTMKALDAFEQKVFLIIGGYEKGSDFTPLYEMLPQKVTRTLIVGATGPRIDSELDARGYIDRTITGDLGGALEWTRSNAHPGDVLLFSPASASFDSFTSYEERGRAFKRLAMEILGQVKDRRGSP